MAQVSLPHPLPSDVARTVAERFRLLGDPTRLLLVDLLRDGEQTVGALARELGCSQANTSKQLALLADGGLLERRREGLRCYYSIADGAVIGICDAVCESLRQHLDRRADALRPPAAQSRVRSASTSAT
jgi:DNA-binding transcriptional ArsR family regulator